MLQLVARPVRAQLTRSMASMSVSEMYADRIIDGERIANELLQDVRVGVDRMKATYGRVPGLAVVLVGASLPWILARAVPTVFVAK